jgi:hypothetical protein
MTPESWNSNEKKQKSHLLGNGSVNTFIKLHSQQWELRCLVAVNHCEVFNKRLPQIRKVKPLEAAVPVRFS